jgi:ABC-type nitrate/sulfonate/bicarbonate transport system substrate-binding protein
MRVAKLVVAAAAVFALSAPADAADKLRVGKSVPNVFAFTPIDVAVETGILAKHGIEVEIPSFQGGAKMHQAMVADAIDIGLGSGPDLSIATQGTYTIAAASLAGPPLSLGFTVWADSPYKTIDDLKGKKIGVATAGSLTHWLVLELARVKGWGPEGTTPVALGAQQANYAALKTKQIDAALQSAAIGWQLEKMGEGRMIGKVDYVKDFHIHVIWAASKLAQSNPELLRRFLAAWFETIAWMRANRDATVPMIAKVTRYDLDVQAREYDEVMPMFSSDGKFNPKAIEVIKQSFVTLGIMEKVPDTSKIVTEQFLPKL